MSDLHRAVQAEIDSFRPDRTPPFSAIADRSRDRDRRRRRVFFGAALAVLAVAGVAVGSGVLLDRPQLRAAGEPRWDYRVEPDDEAVINPRLTEQRLACFTLPGVTATPPAEGRRATYSVTVTGSAERAAFEKCITAVAGVYVPGLAGEVRSAERCSREERDPAPEYLGLSEAEAISLARSAAPGWRTIRVIARDGQCLPITRDLVPTRVNLVLRDGEVVWAGRF